MEPDEDDLSAKLARLWWHADAPRQLDEYCARLRAERDVRRAPDGRIVLGMEDV